MEGEVILKHPNKSTIDEMLGNGHKAEDVSKYLKQIQKNKRWQTSTVTIQHYRKNFLNLTRTDVNRIRRELKASGNTHDENVLTTFTAAKDFIDGKMMQTQEMYNFINDFKTIKQKALDVITLIETNNKDADGNPTFRARDFEIMEKFMGRIESSANSYLKAVTEMQKQGSANGASQTNINVSTMDMDKYTEAFREIIKKIAMELSPDKINRMIAICEDGISKVTGAPTSNVQIQINSAGEGSSVNNINIITSSSLPTAEEADKMAENISNENTLENVIDIQPEKL